MIWKDTIMILLIKRYSYIMILSVMLLLSSGAVGLTSEGQNVQYFKMISVVEYTGKGQFRNQAETLFEVRKEALPNNEVQYFFTGNDQNPNLTNQSSSTGFSFILDRNNRHMSGVGEDMAFWAKVNNESIKSLKLKVTQENVGKTWKQTFGLSSISDSLPRSLGFTLTAIKLKTEMYGEMIAVRALSEPFFVKTGKDSIRSKINAIYLFDPEIEDIYLSMSVFEATADTNGTKEILRHEVATYRTDSAGASVDLSGLGQEFEKFVRKVGLSSKGVKVVEESPLPQWAQSEGLTAAQVANMCAAMACEGAPNPVVTVCIPAARTVGAQSLGQIPSIGTFATAETVAGSLGKSVTGIGTMKIAAAPGSGLGLGTTATVAGLGTAGGLAIDNNTGGDSSHRSPSTP
jgi:hypothetical protein